MVIVSLTTIPTRLNGPKYYSLDIRECINTLLNQTYNEYEIHLNIPTKHKFTGEEYLIPDWLIEKSKENPKLKLFTGVEDLGPVTKLFHTVDRVTNPEDIIIVVDDDILYDKDMVKEQVKNQSKFFDAVVGYDGIDSVDDFYLDVRKHFCSGTNEHNKVKVLQHYKSVSYKRKYFEDDFFDFVRTNLSWNDDLLVSAYFSLKKRDKISTFHESDPVPTTEDEWRNTVGSTFPMRGHTQHERQEGCNVYRDEKVPDLHYELYKIIDTGYYEERFDSLQTVIYTTQNTLPLAEVACEEFLLHAPKDSNITIVTNFFNPDYTCKFGDKIFCSDVPNKGGNQFGEVMIKYLNSIDNEFILFLLDDYITYRKFSRHDFNKLLKLMSEEKVDYFTFDKKQEVTTRQFKPYHTSLYDDGLLSEVSSIDLHRLSVQPCIWRRTALLELLNKYPELNVHRLETDQVIAGENLKTLGFNWHVFTPKIPSTEGFEHHFVFSSVEIVRSGVFMVPENGFARSREDFPCQTVYKLIDKYKMKESSQYDNVLYKL